MAVRRFLLERRRDPICALATGVGSGAIGVIRVSGSGSLRLIRGSLPFLPEKPESHRVYYGHFRSQSVGEVLDEVLVSYFAEGRSFTTEETLEISCHGGAAVIDSILAELVATGFRIAEPGEFTFRAFENGRVDLVQVESVLDLVQARTREASRVAVRHLKGALSERLHALEGDLVWVQSRLEANIDFAQEDIVIEGRDTLLARLDGVLSEISELRSTFESGRLIREGLRVALVGTPNAGKSSLLNRLLREERAIVSPIAGTTRDPVGGELLVDGVRVHLFDTAGLRDAVDVVERLGVDRTMRELELCDAVVWLVDGSARSLQTEDMIREDLIKRELPVFVGLNKVDLLAQALVERQLADFKVAEGFQLRATSVETGQGVDDIVSWLKMLVRKGGCDEASVAVNNRQFETLGEISATLSESRDLLARGVSEEFVAAEVGAAVRLCGTLLGKVYDDEVMDKVFRDFCLGK